MSTNREVSQLHMEVGVDADDKRRISGLMLETDIDDTSSKRRVSGLMLETDIDDTSSKRRISGLLLEVDILEGTSLSARRSLLGVGV